MVCKVPLVTKPASLQVPLSLGYQSEAAFTSRQNFRTSMSVCVTDRIAANKMSVTKQQLWMVMLCVSTVHVLCCHTFALTTPFPSCDVPLLEPPSLCTLSGQPLGPHIHIYSI